MQVKETDNKSGGMTAQETGAALAAGVKELAEAARPENGEQKEGAERYAGENMVTLTETDFEGLIQRAARTAVKEFKKEERQEKKRDKYHNTFTLMKCYRDAVFHIEHAVSDGEQLGLAGMTDEQRRTYLESVRRSRFKTLIMTEHIDKAVEEIERRRKAAGREIEYRAFELYFMQGWDYAQIAEELDTGKNTPRRWVTAIINELSILLWGIDEERVR